MTALELIDDIFSRPQLAVAVDVRRITRDQVKYLRDLIELAGPAGRIQKGAPGSLIWSPEGLYRYVVTEDLRGGRHTLARLSNAPSAECGLLF
jgi:hypothetical protein